MRIEKYKGQFVLYSGEEEWCVAVRGLPKEAPAKNLSEQWPVDEEPDIEDLFPSEIIALISERLESYLFHPGREKKREVVEWCLEHSDQLDLAWAAEEVIRKREEISKLQSEIEDLEGLLQA